VEQDGPAVDKDEIAQTSSPKKEPPKKATPPRRPSPTERGFRATRLTLSKAHQRILDTEADFANVRRSQFLENLLRIRSGSPSGFLRRDGAPLYEFRENDLTDAGETWSWYFTEDAAALLKEAMARLGVRDPVSWVGWALNHWVGRPDGFVKGKDGKYR
jgi:hypothetical protein